MRGSWERSFGGVLVIICRVEERYKDWEDVRRIDRVFKS